MLTSPVIGSSALDPGLWKDPFYLYFTSSYNQTKQTDVRSTKSYKGIYYPLNGPLISLFPI